MDLRVRKSLMMAVFCAIGTVLLVLIHHGTHDVYTEVCAAIGLWATVGALAVSWSEWRRVIWKRRREHLSGI